MDYVCGGQTCPTPLCSFNRSRMQSGLPSRERRHMSHQAGNSMMVSVVGAVMYWCSVYTVDVGSSTIPRHISSPTSSQSPCASTASSDSSSTPSKTHQFRPKLRTMMSLASVSSSSDMQPSECGDCEFTTHVSKMRARRRSTSVSVDCWSPASTQSVMCDPICSFDEWVTRPKCRRRN